MASNNIFSLEGKGLKLDTAADLEAHIAELRANDNIEEVRILGNTLGVEACKLLGEVLATKKNLSVSIFPHVLNIHVLTNSHLLGRESCRYLHRSTSQRDPRSAFLPPYLHSQPS